MGVSWLSKRAILTGIVAVFTLCHIALAQQPAGRLMGRVVDGTGQPLKGVTVYISGPSGTQAGISNPQGYYMLLGVVPGNYEVRINKPGVGKHDSKVTITSNATVRLDVPLGADLAATAASEKPAAERQTVVPREASRQIVQAQTEPREKSGKPVEVKAAEPQVPPAKSDADIAKELAEQERQAQEQAESFVEIPEKTIEIEGGDGAIQRKVKYPELARMARVEGKVVVKVVVDREGSVGNVSFLKPANDMLNQEVLRVINEETKFQPAQQNGKPVSSSIVVQVNFKLDR
jgi:TonB family protein